MTVFQILYSAIDHLDDEEFAQLVELLNIKMEAYTQYKLQKRIQDEAEWKELEDYYKHRKD
jgi:hypothetical protein